MRAIAQIGLRDFDGALRTLGQARRLAREHGNIHTQVNGTVLAARVHLAQGAPERAVETLERRVDHDTSPGMEGDYLATLGFALACCGRAAEAEPFLAESEAMTDHLEARTLRGFARAVAVHAEDPNSRRTGDLLNEALTTSLETGNFDAFVCAYRSVPPLLLAAYNATAIDTGPLIDVACAIDPGLAETVGIRRTVRKTSDSQRELTRREQEVLDLIRQGLSNRQIAQSLWIAESTVKVHVHHLLEKLGARSRTEAAILSKEKR
jgi:DNA-binding CsgD family transcriptional regulator